MTVDVIKRLIRVLDTVHGEEESENCVTEKLEDVLWCVFHADELDKPATFSTYLSDVQYEKDFSSIPSKHSRNMACHEEGWSWCNIIGPGDIEEVNRSNSFLYDATDFYMAYRIYYKTAVYGISLTSCIEKYNKGESAYDYLLDELDNQGDYELCESLVCAEEEYEGDFEDAYMYWLFGALWISCFLDNQKMCRKYLSRFESLSRCHLGSVEYFQSFVDRLARDFGFSGKTLRKVCPYLFDVFFSCRYAETEGGYSTPTLYIFSSEPMAEYRKLRKGFSASDNPNISSYVELLDKLVAILENPMILHPVGEGAYIAETDSISTDYINDLASMAEYTDREYVACYYYYDLDYVSFHPYLWLARTCFEKLFAEFKGQINLPEKEAVNDNQARREIA